VNARLSRADAPAVGRRLVELGEKEHGARLARSGDEEKDLERGSGQERDEAFDADAKTLFG
jgi:hypothetical protein